MMKAKTRFLHTFDFDRVVDIDKNAGIYKWGDEKIRSFLSKRNIIGIVATNSQNKILGFCIYDLQDPDVFNILHMMVDLKHCRKKVGTVLIDKMKSKINSRRSSIECLVPEHNMDVQFFFKKMKFKSNLVRSVDSDFIKFSFALQESKSE